MDTYYGNKYAGLFELDEFVDYLRSGSHDGLPVRFAEYHVKSLREIRAILDRPENSAYAGRVTFRGQTEDFWIRRPVPNPRAKSADGSERMIVPSQWRKAINRSLDDRESKTSASVFASPLLSSPLLYHDIPDWRNHLRHIAEHLGEPDPCKVCSEIATRREAHSLDAVYSNDGPLLEQHYGMPTMGLDVTFDPAVGAFFASHNFVRGANGRASFEPVRAGDHQGIIYCFVFESPSVTETGYMVREVPLFRNIPPLRPIRQRCGLPAFHVNEIAAAVRDLHAVFYLDAAFDLSELPSASYLFPGRQEDRFYGVLVELREWLPQVWGDIVEYDDV
jgi:hypothetical protein